MSRINVFVSHSHKDKEFAGLLKSCFEKHTGFEIFLAHDDLFPSDKFPKEILVKIHETDFFIVLISKNIFSSSFANQEIGVAYEIGKKIIPISIDGNNPDGFIKDLHTLKIRNRKNEYELVQIISKIYSLPIQHPHYFKYKDRAIESITFAVLQCSRYKVANSIFKIISNTNQLCKLNKKQINGIISATGKNQFLKNTKILYPKVMKFLKEELIR